MPSGYVYLLPLCGEDWLKVGISTDPLRRAREFSRRFFDAFDFDRALLLETGSPRDAAAIERDFRRRFRPHRAPMPLTVRLEAGGQTEWYRGAYPELEAALRGLGAQGYALHAPARAWFAAALRRRSEDLHPWASSLLRQYFQDPDGTASEPLPDEAASLLLDTVEAFHRFGIGVAAHLPAALQPWYRSLPPLPANNSYIEG